MEQRLYLGVSRRIITPKIGALLYGYRPSPASTSVNDDLTATAFYFKQGNAEAVLVSATVCAVNDVLTETLANAIEKKHGVPKTAFMLHAVHTHSGPALSANFGWGDVDTEYRDEIFIPRVLEAVDEAVKSAAPVKMGIAWGDSLIGINRRELTPENDIKLGQNPWGPFNPKMTVLSFKDDEGNPVANLIHYGMHGTCAGKNTEISRDWSGVMVDVLEGETGAITAFINGPEGDIGPRLVNGKTTGCGDITYAMRHGAVAGQDAVRVYNNMGIYHTPKLTVYGGTAKIPLQPRLTPDEARAKIEEYKKESYKPQLREQMTHYYNTVIDSYNENYEDKTHSEVKQTIIRLGDVAIVSFPYDLFSEIGLRIDRASKIPHVLSLAHTSGAFGYFPTESALCRGGYEVTAFTSRNIQPPVPNADWHLITETLKNLEKTES